MTRTTEHPPIFTALLNQMEGTDYVYGIDAAPMRLARSLAFKEGLLASTVRHPVSNGSRPPGYDLDEHNPYL